MTFTPAPRDDEVLTTAYLIFLQTAAVLGAVAILATFFSGSAWHWTLAPIFDVWAGVVRPVIKQAFDATVTPFLADVFQWQRSEISPPVQDYLTAGLLINAVAMARLRRQQYLYGMSRWESVLDAFTPGALFAFFGLLLLWPVLYAFTYFVGGLPGDDLDANRPLRVDVVTGLPGIYAATLWVTNALLPAILVA